MVEWIVINLILAIVVGDLLRRQNISKSDTTEILKMRISSIDMSRIFPDERSFIAREEFDQARY